MNHTLRCRFKFTLAIMISLISLQVLANSADNTLYSNASLYQDQLLQSANGQYRLQMQTDGNLTLSSNENTILWETKTSGNPGAYLTMQGDGNAVLYKDDGLTAITSTNTEGNAGAYLTIQDDGNLVINGSDGNTVLWSSNTAVSCDTSQGTSIQQGFTADFQNWLNNNGYASLGLYRGDLSGGSFGGKVSQSDCANKQPVIFVHGNGDRCMDGLIGGWEESIVYFTSKGYRSSELYCTSYGAGTAATAAFNYHSKDYLIRIRKMIEAVLAYTGAEKVDIFGHSMGVTLARKAIKGGWASDLLAGGDYYIGPSLTASVDTFVGIAGGNQGLASCYLTGPSTPGCGTTNGFYPGYMLFGKVFGISDFLKELNRGEGFEGSYRYSIWSSVDQVVGGACLVWFKNTCKVPGQTGDKHFSSYPYGHLGLKDHTGYYQYRMVHDHATN